MKGLRMADEMEISINLRAIQIAWVYSALFLLVWVVYDWIKIGSFNAIAFILMTSQSIIYWTVQLYLKWNLGKDEK